MHPFWQDNIPKFYEQFVNTNDAAKQTIKQTNSAKDQLKIAVQKTEQRIRDEQKSVSVGRAVESAEEFFLILNTESDRFIFQVKNQKRLVRVQELMSSEEERKKIKHQKAVSYRTHAP